MITCKFIHIVDSFEFKENVKFQVLFMSFLIFTTFKRTCIIHYSWGKTAIKRLYVLSKIFYMLLNYCASLYYY